MASRIATNVQKGDVIDYHGTWEVRMITEYDSPQDRLVFHVTDVDDENLTDTFGFAPNGTVNVV